MYYCGIGARKTPLQIKNLMTEIAMHMARYDWILRSGRAGGADLSFETGAGDKKEIFLPSKGFNGSNSHLYPGSPLLDQRASILSAKVWSERELDGKVKCPWSVLKPYTKHLMTRNMYQVCGADLNEISRLVICWTADGQASGGTGHALHAVEMMKVRQSEKLPDERKQVPSIINLFVPSSVEYIRDMLRNNTDPNHLWP